MPILTIIPKDVVTESIKTEVAKILNVDALKWSATKPQGNKQAQKAEIQHVSETQRQQIYDLSDKNQVDIIIQPSTDFKLVVFDMDSTLIQAECIDLIAESVGVGAEVSAITEAAMRGELDFSQSLARRVGLLKGVPNTIYGDLKRQIQFMPGARELAAGLRAQGIKTAVLSGGFVPIAKWVQSELQLDHAHANTLSESAGILIGKTEGEIVDGAKKAELLQAIAKQHKIPLEQVMAVGDGSNDLPMMGVAGFGVAFKAKPLVQQKAPSRLNSGNLADLLFVVE